MKKYIVELSTEQSNAAIQPRSRRTHRWSSAISASVDVDSLPAAEEQCSPWSRGCQQASTRASRRSASRVAGLRSASTSWLVLLSR